MDIKKLIAGVPDRRVRMPLRNFRR